MARRLKKRCEESPILHPGCRRIDIGASDLFVAVSADHDPNLFVVSLPLLAI